MTSRSLELVFFDAGGGHRAAAEALKSVLAERYPDWDVVIVNLQDILKPVDPLFLLTGVPSQNFYNAALKKGLTYGSGAFLSAIQAAIKMRAPHMENILRWHWHPDNGRRIDAVVSLIPNFNGVMFRALKKSRPQVPFVTIMTDMADSPKRFWQEDQDQYIICGTEYAAAQARKTGFYRPERIYKTSGMILRPAFYDRPQKPLTRSHIGLADNRPVALIMFGGYGSSLAEDIVDRLNKAKLDIQTIVLCGRNEKLRNDLRGKKGCRPIGFTPDVADYMRLSDFFIGKPGPGSISEAWHMGLPVIVESNARTMIQERPNTMLVQKLGAGIAVKSFSTIARTVRSLTEDGRLEVLRANVRKLHNNAVFEIPDILARIMDEPETGQRPRKKHKPRRSLTQMAKKWARQKRQG